VRVDPVEAQPPVVARLPEIRDRIDLAYVGEPDPGGAQLVYLIEGKAGGGARLFEIVLDELRGVVRFEVYSAGRSKLRRFTRELESSTSIPVVEADSAAVRALVARIAAGHPGDRPFPSSFSEWRTRLAPSDARELSPGLLVRRELTGGAPDEALEGLTEALRRGELSAWPGDPGAMQAAGKQLQEALGGEGEGQGEGEGEGEGEGSAQEREAAIAAAARVLFDETFAAKTASRFEESAFVQWKQGQEDAARARLAAADTLRASSAGDSPVARALVEAYFSSLLEIPESGA
jgi:hypothetical protein